MWPGSLGRPLVAEVPMRLVPADDLVALLFSQGRSEDQERELYAGLCQRLGEVAGLRAGDR
jgi:hypothetical protein